MVIDICCHPDIFSSFFSSFFNQKLMLSHFCFKKSFLKKFLIITKTCQFPASFRCSKKLTNHKKMVMIWIFQMDDRQFSQFFYNSLRLDAVRFQY